MEIPFVLDAKEFGAPSIDRYELLGAIIHVEDHQEEESEGGHYVCLVRQQDAATSDQTMYLIDDDQVRSVSGDRALEILCGTRDENGSFMCGFLVVYRNKSHMEESCLSSKDSPVVDWTLPMSLVGRRLRVKWAKGKFYSGVVAAYVPETGKHQVLYDDGDLKNYVLRKKTIEWEEKSS